MLVVCKIPIKNTLTYGKRYEVLDIISYENKKMLGIRRYVDEYVVISDDMKKIQISVKRFEPLSEVRKRKLSNI